MGDSGPVPSHVAGFTIMGNKALRFGVFGTDYLGHSAQGLRLLKVLGPGESLAMSESDYAELAQHAQLVHFAAGETGDASVLATHTLQASAFGVAVGRTHLQSECIETTREFDEEQRNANSLRSATLVQRIQLLRALADSLARLHEAGVQAPYLSPWNVVLDNDAPRIAEVGLGYAPQDPGFDRANLDPDMVVFHAPEVLAALKNGTVVQTGPAADVYALASTTWAFLHGAVPKPKGDGEPLDRALAGLGFEPEAEDRYSTQLRDLIQRGLSVDPQKRPSAAEFAQRLGQLVDQDLLTYVPPPTWPKFAAVGVIAVALLVVLFLALRPSPELEKARNAFAQATQAADPAAQLAALEEAKVTGDGGTQDYLPEARRLRALARYRLWRSAPDAEGHDLRAVVEGLEQDLVGEHEDDVARVGAFVAGTLRRYEFAEEEDRALGTEALSALAKGQDDLAKLAAAALVLTPTGVEGKPSSEDLTRWAEAASNAWVEQSGALNRAYTLHDEASYGVELETKPRAVALDAAWVAYLIGGRAQAVRGAAEDARSKLQSAYERLAIWSTQAAYGLHLARTAKTAEDAATATELVTGAMAKRPFAEGTLALGEAQLAQAHVDRDPAAYEAAIATLQEAAGQPAATPGVDVQRLALELENEARFYRAMALAVDPSQLEAATDALDELLQDLQDAPELLDRFGLDAHVARGLVRARLGKLDKAVEDLRYRFRNLSIADGYADLPDLDPTPLIRSETKAILGPLADALVAEAKGLAEQATPTKDQVTAAERALKDLTSLYKLPDAAALDPSDALLARARVMLAKARAYDGSTAQRALEDASKAASELLDKVDPDTPERWLTAVETKLEVLKERASAMPSGAEVGERLAPIGEALGVLARLSDLVPASLRRQWRDFAGGQEQELNAQFLSQIQSFMDERKEDWDAIDVAKPSYDEQQAKDEIGILEQSVRLAGDDVEGKKAYELGLIHYRLAQLNRALRLNPKVSEHYEQAVDLLARVDEGDLAGQALREKVNYLFGWVALNEGNSLGGDPRKTVDRGYDALARAAGASNFADLKSKLKSGSWQPKQDPARAIAAHVVKTTDTEETVPRDPPFGKEISNARRLKDDMEFVARLDDQNPNAFLVLARIQFSQGKDELQNTVRNADKAYTLSDDRETLATKVQAARLYCYARFLLSDKSARDTERFLPTAEAGMRAANELIGRDATQAKFSYNYAPAYWVARSHYEQARELYRNGREAQAKQTFQQAIRAYEAFEKLVSGKDIPAEAEGWVQERNNAIIATEE
ncbi:MAG: hypothetical protein R3F62_31545 [Planctomycetota bacterium]